MTDADAVEFGNGWARIEGTVAPGRRCAGPVELLDTFRDPLSLAEDLERIAKRYGREGRRLRGQERIDAWRSAAVCRQWACDLRAGIG